METIINKLKVIKEKGWLKSVRDGTTGVGATFEYYMGIEENNLPTSDFEGYEIKTKLFYSKSYIQLFNLTPQSSKISTIKYLTNTYGYPDKILKEYNILNNSLYYNKLVKINKTTFFTIKIDYKCRRINLHIINYNYETIEKNIYWDFDDIEKAIYNKIKNLIIVKSLKKRKDNINYYKYYKFEIYKLKSFESFIKQIEDGIIRITFKIGIFRNGPRIGQIHDHGTSFDIRESDILKLYNRINTIY